MSKWMHKNKVVEEPPKDKFGFIYKLRCLLPEYMDYIYVGSKSFYSTTNAKISKKRANELYTGKGARKKREKKVKMSDWLTYTTSSNIVKELINQCGLSAFTWEILEYGINKADLLLREVEVQCRLKVFRIEKSFNQMLKASIYKKNI